MQKAITVRQARGDDLRGLAALERRTWGRRGTPVLSIEDLAAWLAEESPYFLVAEASGVVCGYYFGRQIHFDPRDIATFLDPSRKTAKGFSAHAHDPLARSVYGICVTASVPGAGTVLNQAVHRLLRERRARYFVGFTRLPGFEVYYDRVQSSGYGGIAEEDTVALWYAHESASLLGMRQWSEAAPCPNIALPPLRRPDPVLAFHVRGTTLGLLAVVPGYMTDPASRDYGAFIASEAPHT